MKLYFVTYTDEHGNITICGHYYSTADAARLYFDSIADRTPTVARHLKILSINVEDLT